MLEKAATLFVLRRNTLWIIDGPGPGIKTDRTEGTDLVQMDKAQAEQVLPPNEEQKLPGSRPTGQAPLARPQEEVAERAASDKCPFSGVVPIDIKRFETSGVARVECPNCGRVWTLSPHGRVLRFKSHDKRKMNTPNTGQWWARGKEKQTGAWLTSQDDCHRPGQAGKILLMKKAIQDHC